VKWCLSKLEVTNFLLNWSVDGRSREIEFPLNTNYKLIKMEPCKTQHNNIKIPLWNNLNSLNKDEVPIETAEAFQEWLGLISCNLVHNINIKSAVDPVISTFETPLEISKFTEVLSLKWEGLINTDFIINIMTYLKDNITRLGVPWIGLLVFGFDDAPISWGSNEHGYLYSGENDYIFLLFPNNTFCNLTLLSPQDNTT